MTAKSSSLQKPGSVSAAKRTSSPTTEASAAGLSGGTGFAGLVILLTDGTLKSVLLILAPTITVIITSSWHLLIDEIGSRVADWRIKRQRMRAESIVKNLNQDPNTSEEIRKQAQSNLDALTLLEVEIGRKRVEAIVVAS